MKIWTCRSSLRSGSQNAWTRMKNVNGASRLSNFWNFFGATQIISCRDWWPWTKPDYITLTRRQSNNQWSGGIAAHPSPRNSECKNQLEKFWPRFFGIKTASSSSIKRAKLSTRSNTHLCWCKWRKFWRKNAAGRSPRGSCSCTKMPQLTRHLQSRRNWHAWAPKVLITHLILRTWPRRNTISSLDWKEQLKGRHFSSDAEVIAAAETWLDGQTSEVFWVACKSYSNGLRSLLSFVGCMLNKSRVWSP